MKLKSVLGALLAAVSLGGCCAKCESKPLQSIAPENAKITEVSGNEEKKEEKVKKPRATKAKTKKEE